MKKLDTLINNLNLKPHPEGGYYKETYRSEGEISSENLGAEFIGSRSFSTCIYFLLTSETFSAFHKINQDEIWHFYQGSPIVLHTLSTEGVHNEYTIGNDLEKGQVPQLIVPAQHWFAAKVMDENSFSLVGCTVSPGFDFKDFILPKRSELQKQFPIHTDLIKAFSRE